MSTTTTTPPPRLDELIVALEDHPQLFWELCTYIYNNPPKIVGPWREKPDRHDGTPTLERRNVRDARTVWINLSDENRVYSAALVEVPSTPFKTPEEAMNATDQWLQNDGWTLA